MNEILDTLHKSGAITDTIHANEKLAVCTPKQSWRAIALAASKGNKALIYPSAYGISVVANRKAFYLQQANAARDLEKPECMLTLLHDAARVMQELGIEKHGWSLGNMARQLLEYIGPKDQLPGNADALKIPGAWGFLHARPGYHGEATEYDVKSCYYSLWCRLKSLYPLPINGKVGWGRQSDAVTERFHKANSAIAEHKKLRNILVGCAVGSQRPFFAVAQDGKWQKRKAIQGRFSGAGMLIVRSAYEMCREVADSSYSYHSAVDSVIVGPQANLSAWADSGMTVRMKASGDTDVKAWAAFKCGEHVSTPYDPNMYYCRADAMPKAPEYTYFRSWLQ